MRVSPTGRKVWFVIVREQCHVKRITIGTYPAISLAEAREKAGKFIRNARLGTEPAANGVPYPRRNRSCVHRALCKARNRSWRDAERLLGNFQSLFGKSLHGLKRSDVVRVLDTVVASGRPFSANRALSTIKKLMAWALDRGMIEINPIAGLKPPAKEHARERVLTDNELASFWSLPMKKAIPSAACSRCWSLQDSAAAKLRACGGRRSILSVPSGPSLLPNQRTVALMMCRSRRTLQNCYDLAALSWVRLVFTTVFRRAILTP